MDMALSGISTILHKLNTAVADGVSELMSRLDSNNNNNTGKTIVLDMENTIIHSSLHPLPHYDFTVSVLESNDICYVQKRPAVDQLFQHLANHNYEIIIFTSSSQEYADPILDKLNHTINLRLYTDPACNPVKDLSKLNRDLKNVVIVDDDPAGYKLQPENAFPVKPFHGELSDRDLYRVIDFCEIAAMCSDVRDAIRTYAAMGGSNSNSNAAELAPYERPCINPKKTLVLELFDVLIKASLEPLQHHDFAISLSRKNAVGMGEIVPCYIVKRPGVENLLLELSEDYEIVVFTEAEKMYADLIIDKLVIDSKIARRLYGDSCARVGSDYVKDLTKITPSGRTRDLNLKDVIMVDINPNAYKFQPENGILVKPFDGDMDDRELYGVIGFCKSAGECKDVREAVRLHTDTIQKSLIHRKLHNFKRSAELLLMHHHPHFHH